MEHLQNIVPQDDPRYNIIMSSLEDPKAVDRLHTQIANQGIADASKPPETAKPAPQVEAKRDIPTGTAMEQLIQRVEEPPEIPSDRGRSMASLYGVNEPADVPEAVPVDEQQ